jgi:hypothetical protein
LNVLENNHAFSVPHRVFEKQISAA